eukprot:gene17111-20382_t
MNGQVPLMTHQPHAPHQLQQQLQMLQQQQQYLQSQQGKQGSDSTNPKGEKSESTKPEHLQSRVYIGNIHFSLTEADLTVAFAPYGPIKSLNLSKDPTTGKSKGYCFIEYSYPDAATNAIQHMNQQVMAGRPIKVGRPYIPVVNQSGGSATPTTNVSTSNTAATTPISTPTKSSHLHLTPTPTSFNPHTPTPVSTNVITLPTPPPKPEVPISENRIYVGSIPWNVTEEQIKVIFSSLGNIVSCSLMPNVESGRHKGYGFIDYDNPKSADDAISSLNGLDMGGRTIKVGKPIKNASGSSDSTKTSSTSFSASSESIDDDVSISSEQRILLTQKLLGNDVTRRCMVLRNLGRPNEIDEFFEEEIKMECSSFGPVDKVVLTHDASTVKAFILFKDSKSCATCLSKQNGRFFSGNIVIAEYYDITQFNKGVFN